MSLPSAELRRLPAGAAGRPWRTILELSRSYSPTPEKAPPVAAAAHDRAVAASQQQWLSEVNPVAEGAQQHEKEKPHCVEMFERIRPLHYTWRQFTIFDVELFCFWGAGH